MSPTWASRLGSTVRTGPSAASALAVPASTGPLTPRPAGPARPPGSAPAARSRPRRPPAVVTTTPSHRVVEGQPHGEPGEDDDAGRGHDLGPAGHAQPGPVVADHRADAPQVQHPGLEAGAALGEAGRGPDEEDRGGQPGDHDADPAEADAHEARHRQPPARTAEEPVDEASLRRHHRKCRPGPGRRGPRSSTMIVALTAVIGQRYLCPLRWKRRMLSTLNDDRDRAHDQAEPRAPALGHAEGGQQPRAGRCRSSRQRTADTSTDLQKAFSAWAGVYSAASAGTAVVSLTPQVWRAAGRSAPSVDRPTGRDGAPGSDRPAALSAHEGTISPRSAGSSRCR